LFVRFLGGLVTTAMVLVGVATPASALTNEPAYDALNVSSSWDAGYLGQNVTVALIDQGVNLNHEYFQGQVVDGICVYQANSSSRCPNGTRFQTGVAAASQRAIRGWLVEEEDHGNMVAGIVAGKPNTLAPGGIAPQAKLLMANTDMQPASVVAALDYIYENREKHNIVAVSMSFGILGLSSRQDLLNCNTNPVYAGVRASLKRLRSVGIIPFAAAGNGFYLDSAESWAPTCLDEAVSIGSVDSSGNIAVYNTMSTKVELLATEYAISASTYGYAQASGTSAAAPSVAASFALLKQEFKDQNSEVILSAMKLSGKKIDDVVRKDVPMVDLAAARALLAKTPINEAPVAPVVEQKITVGAYNGYVAIYTQGHEGSKLTAKVAGKWLTVNPITNQAGKSYSLTKRFTGAGYNIAVDVYIDGVKLKSTQVLTR
jgi:subtilisin family serine protease